MSVFVFSGQDGVGKTSFAGFCQVKSRRKGSPVTDFKAHTGLFDFGQAGVAKRGIWAFRVGYGGLKGQGEEGWFDRGWTGQKGRASALARLYWLRGVIEKKRAFCRGSTGLHECAVVLGRMDWAEALKTRFSVLCVVMMGRIDWLRDVDAGLGKDVLAIALEFWVNLEEKRRMGRMDWTRWASATDGKDMEGKICEKAGWLGLTWRTAVV